jgi:hypothetical protein
MRPSIWNWWLYSPINPWFRRLSFLTLVLSFFGTLFPSLASKLIFYVYNSVFNPIFTSQFTSGFPIFISVISSVIVSLGNFFSSVNWQENTVPLTFLAFIIIFALGSPSVQHLKSSQIEVEIRPPPTFELIPCLIEKKLKELESCELI